MKKFKKVLSLVLAFVMMGSLVVISGCGSGEGGSGEGEPLKVALLLSGPANDQGWNATAIQGLDLVKEELGAETAYMENVQLADSEASYRDYASQGYDVVIGHGFQFGEPALRVSKEFPDTYFASTESNTSGENMSSYVIGAEQGAYIMGLVSASMSESGKIGVVGGFEQPSIVKEVEAFKLAAKEVKPEIEIYEAYLNSFTDVTAGKSAATSMLDQGVDVLYHVANQAGTGVIKAAEEKGIFACGNSYDQNSIAPATVLSSTVYNVPDVIYEAVKQVQDGTFESGVFNLGMAEDIVEIAPYHDLEAEIPEDVRALLEENIQAITDGSKEIPIIEQPTK